jgi:hypothetical protein
METKALNLEGVVMNLAKKREPVSLYFLLPFVLTCQIGYCGSVKEPERILKRAEESISSEKIKAKFHEATDAISREKVHEKIDSAADYLDPESLKEKVDEIADYLDREKVKEFVDYLADNLDKEKVKQMIDMAAEVLDRERIKQGVDQIADAIDVEKIQGKFDESVDKIAGSLKEATGNLEQELRSLGSNKDAIQGVLKKYKWNQWIKDRAIYGPATLSNFKLGSSKKVAIVHSGQEIKGEVTCNVDRKQCSAFSMYRVVLGIKNQGGQTTVFNHFGLRAGKETDPFTLVAPRQKGIYEVAFRLTKAASEGMALQSWDAHDENGWGEPVTLGLLIVI